MSDATMSDASGPAPAAPGAPSDLLMALYTGRRDDALALAAATQPTLPELAALADLDGVRAHIARTPAALQDHSGDGWTALHLAGFFGADAVAVVLLRAGADHGARARNAQGNTPLHAAIAGRRDHATILALLAGGSDAAAVDAQGYTPLHLAASRGDAALCDLLLACGAVRGTTTPDGRTAADIARERTHETLAVALAG